MTTTGIQPKHTSTTSTMRMVSADMAGLLGSITRAMAVCPVSVIAGIGRGKGIFGVVELRLRFALEATVGDWATG